MVAYQKTGNQAKMLETAQKLLQVNPCNIRALALVTYSKQASATGPNAQQSLAEAGQSAEKGLQCWTTATKPADTPAADWDKLKSQTTAIFNNAAGMAAYAAKDYGKAEQFLRAAVEADPANLTEVYYLALADLAAGPARKMTGRSFLYRPRFEFADRTLTARLRSRSLARANTSKYHGSEDGWTDVLTLTATATKPPDNFAIKTVRATHSRRAGGGPGKEQES